MNFPVFDLHCDTADKLLIPGSQLRSNEFHIDLDRAAALPGYAQCFACYTTTLDAYNPVDCFEKKLAVLYKELNLNSDRIRIVYDTGELEKNREQGWMSAILAIEGPAGFGFDPELLDDLYQVGFRLTTLGWNEKNPLTGSHATGGGLTELGKEYVTRAQKLGMLVDVSHISDEGFWDIMKITDRPVIASHSNSRSLCDCSRNLTDDMFRALCETGGVAGINLYPDFLGNAADSDTVCDHILHFLDLDPEGKHIALGGDLDGVDRLPTDISGIQDYPIIAQKLLQRGVSEDIVYQIYWKNAVEVFDNAICKRQ